jgi:hypothetical protein
VPRFAFVLFVAALAFACTKPLASREVADRFVDTYYEQIDPEAAVRLSTGAAKKKLQEELGRLAGVGSVPEDERPHILTKFESGGESGDAASFVYRVESISDGVYRLRVDLDVVEVGDQWLVADFREHE